MLNRWVSRGHRCLAALALLAMTGHGSAFSPVPRSPSTWSLLCWPEFNSLHDRPVHPPVRPWVRPQVGYVPETASSETAQLRRVTGILERLLCIILSADDVALSEREAVKIGRVFMDARGNMTRLPVLLRQETLDLMLEYGIEPQLVKRKWQLERRNSAAD